MASAETRAFDARAEELVPTTYPLAEDNREPLDEHETVVIFKRYRSGGREVIALFPEIPADYPGTLCTSYMHVGQHSGANFLGVTEQTRPANLDDPDVKALIRELEHRGYRLKIQRRRTAANFDAFNAAVRAAR